MDKKTISGGVVHTVPADMRHALLGRAGALSKWNDLTPLARNEWICWVTSVKKEETRADHVRRLTEDLLKGKRRPCCWVGCIHRTDKPISASVQTVLRNKQSKKKL
jgi:hypothetical protein